MLAAVGLQLLAELVRGLHAVGGLDDRLDLLAELVVGDPEHGDVLDRVVVDERRLDLRGVDVHAAADDHVDLAVRQEDEPVVVDVAHVAEREHPRLEVDVLGLLGGVVVLEVGAEEVAEVERADLVGAELLAVLADHEQLAGRRRRADGPRVVEPFLRLGPRRDASLGGAVALVNDRAPPVHHRLLDVGRAGSRGVPHVLDARHVVLLPHVLGELEQAHEERGHRVERLDVMLLDEPQHLLGVELAGEHHLVAVRGGDGDGGEGAGVVHRRHHEGLAVAGELHDATETLEHHLDDCRVLADGEQ